MIEILADRLFVASLDAAVLAGLVWLLQRAMPGLPAPLRAWLWWAVGAKVILALLGIAPIGLMALPGDEARSRHEFSAPAPVELGTPERLDSVMEHEPLVPGTRAVAPGGLPQVLELLPSAVDLLVLLWLVGVAAVGGMVMRRWWAEKGILASAESVVDLRARLRLAQLAASLGVRAPALASSPAVSGPLVHGLLAPRIVLPPQALDSRRDELELVLAHELAHLRRFDLWLGVVPELARILLFFHPLVAIALREYALAREAACDALALRTLGTAPRDYGAFLLRWGTTRRESGLAAAAVAPSAQQLRRRLEMLRFADRSFRSRPLMAAAILTLLLPVSLIARPSLPDPADAPSPPSPFTPAAAPASAPSVPAAPARLATPAAVAPLAPRAAVAPPAVPAPPAPLAGGHIEGTRLILADGDRTIQISARSSDRKNFDRLRKGTEPLLWFERDGTSYLVRDPGLLARAFSALDEISKPTDEQRVLGEVQRLLADEMAERQAQVAARQAEVAAVHAELAARAAAEGRELAALQADVEAMVEEMIGDLRDELDRVDPAEREALQAAVEARVRAASSELEARAAKLAAAARAEVTPEAERLREEAKTLALQQRELAERHQVLARDLARRQRDLGRQLEQILDESLAKGLATAVD